MNKPRTSRRQKQETKPSLRERLQELVLKALFGIIGAVILKYIQGFAWVLPG